MRQRAKPHSLASPTLVRGPGGAQECGSFHHCHHFHHTDAFNPDIDNDRSMPLGGTEYSAAFLPLNHRPRSEDGRAGIGEDVSSGAGRHQTHLPPRARGAPQAGCLQTQCVLSCWWIGTFKRWRILHTVPRRRDLQQTSDKIEDLGRDRAWREVPMPPSSHTKDIFCRWGPTTWSNTRFPLIDGAVLIMRTLPETCTRSRLSRVETSESAPSRGPSPAS